MFAKPFLCCCFMVVLAACGTAVGTVEEASVDGFDESLALTDALAPSIQVGSFQLRTVGAAGPLQAVSDGADAKLADDSKSYVESDWGRAIATHQVGYVVPTSAGKVTRVQVVTRASRGSGQGTFEVHLLDGETEVARGSPHALGGWAHFGDSFEGLALQHPERLRTKVVLRNSAGYGSLRYSQILIRVTTEPNLKPPVKGLVNTNFTSLAPANFPFVDSTVIKVDWKELETADQRFDGAGWAAIENARSAGQRIRLRVMAGIHAPNFVKQLGHAPMSGTRAYPGPDKELGTGDDLMINCNASGGVALYNAYDGRGGCSTFFWMPEVLDQYEELMIEISRRYDQVQELAEVVDSACMTVYAEPFYRSGDSDSVERLWNAGLDQTKDRACHERGMRIHQQVFKRTRTSLAVNPWDVIDQTGRHPSWAQTYSFAEWARELMGPKLVLQNNGLGENDGCKAAFTPQTSHFCYLASLPALKGFQTETAQRLGEGAGGDRRQGTNLALENGLAMGASSIELPPGYQNFAVPSELQAYDSQLEAKP